MKKTLMTMLMLGVGATSLAAMSNGASAGGKHGWHGHYKWNYAPYGFHYDNHWKNKCHFYYKKAKWTGKRYWWKKYYWCVEEYEYDEGDDD